MASLYHQQAISLMEKRLVATNKVSLSDLSINFFHIFLKIHCRLSKLIRIFATASIGCFALGLSSKVEQTSWT